MTRVLVTGSRDWPEPDIVEKALEKLLPTAWLTIVHGACPTGADAQANEWAKQKIREGYPIEIEPHPALWNIYGKSAGHRRNAEMVTQNANLCLAFIHNNSKGSTNTKELAEKAEIPTNTYRSYSVAGPNDNNVILEGVRLVYKNFAGAEGKYNRAGDRNFSVVLNDEQAEEFKKAGWNVKSKPPREDGDLWFHHLPVAVSFKGRPPRLVLVTKVLDRNSGEYVKARVPLGEEECEMFDYVDAQEIDIILRPYRWNVSGNTGTKAYLHAIYVTLNQDRLELKYESLPEVTSKGEQLALESGQLALEGGFDDDDIEDAEVIEDVDE